MSKPTQPAHHVEAYTESSFLAGFQVWGWQCFTCRAESSPTHASAGAALAASDGHDTWIEAQR